MYMDVSENLVCSDFGSFPGFGWMNPALSPPICTTTTTFWSQRFWTSNTKPENNPKLDQNLWPRNSGRFNLQSDIAYVGSGRSLTSSARDQIGLHIRFKFGDGVQQNWRILDMETVKGQVKPEQ